MTKYEKALKNFEEELINMYGCDEGNMDIDLTLIKELVERATPKEIYYPKGYPTATCPHCGQQLYWGDD